MHLNSIRRAALGICLVTAANVARIATAQDDAQPRSSTLNLSTPGLSLPTDSQSTSQSTHAPRPAPTHQAASGTLDRSRYRKFGDKWWYWLPSKQWALWDGGKWTVTSPRASEYQEWRQQQFAGRYTDSAAQDEALRRREVDRWRGQAAPLSAVSKNDAEYHRQIDRFHDTLMITPFDYRIGTPGHGLFDCDPDRVIANTGRFNYATSGAGYMGGALRSPYGY